MNNRQAASEIYHFLNDAANQAAILAAVRDMETRYQAPINNWWYGIFYQYFRVRADDIKLLKNQLLDNYDPALWFEALMHFFHHGAWSSTSANTYLMSSLLENLSTLTIPISAFNQLYYCLLEQAEKYSKHSLAYILNKQFTDEKIKNHCIQEFEKAYARDLLTRAFDDFQFMLLSQEAFAKLNKEFIIILLNTDVVGSDELVILSEIDQETIVAWEEKIIQLTINNLLDHTGNIKHSILELLNCEQVLIPKQTLGLVCAYAGRIISDIMQEHFSHPAYNSICNFINKNYANLVVTALNAKNNNSKQVFTYTLSMLGLGAGLLLSATVGILLFKQQHKNIPTSDQPLPFDQLNNMETTLCKK